MKKMIVIAVVVSATLSAMAGVSDIGSANFIDCRAKLMYKHDQLVQDVAEGRRILNDPYSTMSSANRIRLIAKTAQSESQRLDLLEDLSKGKVSSRPELGIFCNE